MPKMKKMAATGLLLVTAGVTAFAGTATAAGTVSTKQTTKRFYDKGCSLTASYGYKHDPLGQAGQGYYDSMRVEISPAAGSGNACKPSLSKKISVSVNGPDPSCKSPNAYGRVYYKNFELNDYLLPVQLFENRHGSPEPRPYICN